MRNTFFIGIMAFLSMFVFTGCIDFLEDITYHRNGSGAYQFTMEAGAIKELMGSLGDSEKPEGMGDLSDMTKGFDEVATKLKSVAGITNFQSINDTTNFVFGFSFDFKDAVALNEAMKKQEIKEGFVGTIFSGKKRRLIRSNNGGMANAFKDEMTGGEGEDAEMVKSMFGEMKLRTVYHFDRKVRSSSNENSLISNDKKTVTIDYYFFKPDMNKGDEGVGSTFKLSWW